jgi:peroxiredoxin
MKMVSWLKPKARLGSILRRLTLGAVLLTILWVGVGCTPKLLVTAPEVGALAPDFTISDLDGKPFVLSEFRPNPVVLIFWSTQCPYCHEELAMMQAAYEEKAKDGLVVVAIDVGEDQSTVELFVDDAGYTFAVALDHERTVSADYRIERIPATFLIDSKGVIQLIKVDAFSSTEDILAKLELIM